MSSIDIAERSAHLREKHTSEVSLKDWGNLFRKKRCKNCHHWDGDFDKDYNKCIKPNFGDSVLPILNKDDSIIVPIFKTFKNFCCIYFEYRK